MSPEEINFCLHYYDGEIEACTVVDIIKTGGDNQTGWAYSKLSQPLTVYVTTMDEDGVYVDSSEYQKVKFEVVSGGGVVMEEIVGTNEMKTASTEWILGDPDKEQKVKAVVIDIVTNEEISEPVFFTAKAIEEDDYPEDIVGDWTFINGIRATDWTRWGVVVTYHNIYWNFHPDGTVYFISYLWDEWTFEFVGTYTYDKQSGIITTNGNFFYDGDFDGSGGTNTQITHVLSDSEFYANSTVSYKNTTQNLSDHNTRCIRTSRTASKAKAVLPSLGEGGKHKIKMEGGRIILEKTP
ncbi:MAG: hypothetical protein LBL58_16670 [Tannerellaceae bacterium]|jgi:hypothetical protein|nr:hypothetical protein [Tannerellaceae bacterium]